MGGSDDQRESVDPSEQRGGKTPGEHEAREKGPWAETAREGVVPAELGGSDAPPEMLDKIELADPPRLMGEPESSRCDLDLTKGRLKVEPPRDRESLRLL